MQITLSNNGETILYQNEPNPFDENTVIRYFIPENNLSNSLIVFYDSYGKEINKMQVSGKGAGQLNVNTANLGSGIYSYSLVIDGKVIDTKKMMKSK